MADDKIKINLDDVIGIEAPDNEYYGVESELPELKSDLTPEDIEEVGKEIELERKYGDRSLEAFGLGAASGLTYSASELAAIKAGLYTRKELKEIKKRNALEFYGGDIGASIAAAAASGGTSLVGKVAAKTAPSLIAKASQKAGKEILKTLTKNAANKKFTKKLVEKVSAENLGSAMEAAAFNVHDLLREDILGDAEFNATNALVAAGTGAVMGGAASKLFGGVQATIPKAKDIADKSAAKLKLGFMDPIKATKKAFKIKDTSSFSKSFDDPEEAKKIMNFLYDEGLLDKFKSNSNVLKRFEDIKEKSIKGLDDAYETLDSAISKKGIDELNNVDTIVPVMKFLDDQVQRLKKSVSEGDRIQARALEKIVNNIDEVHLGGNLKEGLPLTYEKLKPSQLRTLRQQLDSNIKFESVKDPTEFENAIYQARTMLNETLYKKAELIDENLLNSLKKHNQGYSLSTKFLNPRNTQVGKMADEDINSILNVRDMMMGMTGAIIDPTVTGTILGGKALLKSKAFNKYIVAAHVERTNKEIVKKTNNSLNRFFKNTNLAKLKQFKEPAKKYTILKSAIAMDEKGKKPLDKKQALNNIRANIEKYKDPNVLAEKLIRNTASLNNFAPNTVQAVTPMINNMVHFIDDKIPKKITAQGTIQTLKNNKDYSPSSIEMAKFERYMEAIDNPMSVLDDLEKGSLTREKVEVLENIYPNLYKRIQDQSMEYIANNPDTLNYQQRLKIGTLLNIPADTALIPKNIGLLQANFGAEQEERAQRAQSESLGKYEALDMADDEMTSIEQVEKRN